jgi:uncharacterized protein with FMN-binding domain
MARKMPRGLVALSASAIAGLYLSGYIATQGAATRLDLAAALPTSSPVSTAVIAGPSRGALAPLLSPTPVPSASPSLAAGSTTSSPAYRDGTYEGSGTSRRGGVKVAVTIEDGLISDVRFTQVTTQYPVSRIAALPAQVVARQTAQVDRVTGATYSVQAFQQAVQQALAQATPSTNISA